MPVRNNTVLTILILSQLIAGSTYLVVKLGLREFDPFSLGLLRFLIAGTVFALLLKSRKDFRWFEKRDLGRFLVLALLAVPLNQGLFLYGMQYTLASHGALLYATTPLQVLGLSIIILGERPTALKVAGILLGFCGVILVLFDRGLAFARQTITGDLFVLGGVITWSLYTIYSKKLLARYRPLEVTGFSLTLGSLLFLPVGLPFVLRMDIGQVSRTGIFSLFYLAIMTSVVAYLIWSWALSKLEASKVAVISNLQPVIAAALAWVLFKEPVTVKFVLGTAVVLAGVIMAENG